MNINQFFTNTLGANLRNVRWSWGAYDPATDRVFLRIWDDDFINIDDARVVRVLGAAPKSSSPGYNERRKHIEQIQYGARGYGVVCQAADSDTDGSRTIRQFDASSVTEFSQIIHHNEATYAVIGRHVPVSELAHSQTGASTVADDIATVLRQKRSATEKETMVQARLGQGAFRQAVLLQWNGRCAVTGVSVPQVIRASHIKPWRSSDNAERLDANNGLPLIATLDALFDSGLISFDDSGNLLLSPSLPESLDTLLQLKGGHLISEPNAQMRSFIKFHRTQIFVSS